MKTSAKRYLLCLGLSIFSWITSSCMIGGHGGGGGGGFGGKGPPGPTLTSISPTSVIAGSPPFILTVNGSGFVSGGSLVWNGTFPIPYIFVSSTQVTAQIGSVANAGSASIAATIPTSATPSNALSLTIQPFTSSACVLFGLYDFFFTGFDSSGPVTIAGDFGIDVNGNVSGEEDFKDLATTRAAQTITGGSCSNELTTNQGTLTITTAAGTSTYTFATQGSPAPGVRGRMAESGDTNGISGSGRFISLPPNAGFFSGDYVMALVGSDSSGGRMALVGRFTDTDTNNTSGTLSAGVGDINDNGTVTPMVTIAGSITPPDGYSRATAMLTVGSLTLKFAFYVLGPEAGWAVDVDSGASSPLLAGFVGVQNGPGAYANSLLNAPVVFSTWGTVPGAPTASDTSIGLASGFNSGAGTFNFQQDQVTGGVATLNQTITGATYNIVSNGRATVSFTGGGGKTQTDVLYLDNANDGYILQTSGSNVGFGFFEAQANGPFDNSSINGTFAGGTWFPPVQTSPNTAAQITLNNGNISANTPAGTLSGTYNVGPSGRGTATVNLPAFGSNDLVFYIIGPGSIEVMGSDNVLDDAVGFLHI